MNPKVSIVTVVFRGADTIEDCIDSVAGQSYADIEHVISSGGSMDETTQIMEAFRLNDVKVCPHYFWRKPLTKAAQVIGRRAAGVYS
jgi:glycosyltransferase involved in cell wall biosynthesis